MSVQLMLATLILKLAEPKQRLKISRDIAAVRVLHTSQMVYSAQSCCDHHLCSHSFKHFVHTEDLYLH